MLEALPVEIIEQIFLYCLNLNLPRASRTLSTALSREHLYKLLILLAFWNDSTHGDHEPNEAIKRAFAPLEYVPFSWERRRELQEQIFRCGWCTRARIQEQLPLMMNLTIRRQWIDIGVTMDSDQQAALDRFMAREDNTARSYHGKGPAWKTVAQPLVTPDPGESELSGQQEYELSIRPNENVQIRASGLQFWPALDLLTFPSHLLRGREAGFTEEDVLFLEMLRLCSYGVGPWIQCAQPDPKVKIDREALHEGVQKAIRTQDLDALTSLLKIDEYSYRAPTEFSKPPRMYTIPSHHFITATLCGLDNPARSVAIFEALVRASAESIPSSDSTITGWIIDMLEAIERKGLKHPEVNTRLLHWLSDFMLRLTQHVEKILDGRSKQVFECGWAWNRRRRGWLSDEGESEMQSFVDEVLKPERDGLDNWMLESPYKPADFWCT